VYNIYTSFAELGTLACIFDEHERNGKKCVPEHFIWYVLSQVTEALLALQNGTCSSPSAALEDGNEAVVDPRKRSETNPNSKAWRSILHSDVKDANIFLRSKNTKYPAYPNVVLSDFDVAVEQGSQDAEDRRYNGTPGMCPPVSTPHPEIFQALLMSLRNDWWVWPVTVAGIQIHGLFQRKPTCGA
jgi:serine/threonine protein kinase